MCLKLRDIDSDKPYNDSYIRWKYVEIRYNKLISPFASVEYKSIGEENQAKLDPQFFSLETKLYNIGFHVYTNKEDAIFHAGKWLNNNSCYVKVKVTEFISSGFYVIEANKILMECETWNKMTILEVYDLEGNDITDRFRKPAEIPV